MPPKKVVAPPPVEEPIEEEPPPPPPPPTEDEVTELETGLQLPLRGNDVGDIWAVGEDYDAQAKMLCRLLNLEAAHPDPARRGIICDFYLFNLSQAKALCLSKRQGAVFHAIMHRALVMAGELSPGAARQAAEQGAQKETRRPEDMAHGTSECFEEFRRLMLQHSVAGPPERLAEFKATEARMLTDFASSTFFKHVLLYQFALSSARDVQNLHFRSGVVAPRAPPPLRSGTLCARDDGRAGGDGRAPGDGEGDGEGTAGGEGEDDEDDEVRRLVEEKLRETEAALQAKLDAREAAFQEKMSTRTVGKK